MFDHNPPPTNLVIFSLLLWCQTGTGISLRPSGFLVGDVDFKGLIIGFDPQVTQIEPDLEQFKPIEFRVKLLLKQAVIVLATGHGVAQKQDHFASCGDESVLDHMAFFCHCICLFEPADLGGDNEVAP